MHKTGLLTRFGMEIDLRRFIYFVRIEYWLWQLTVLTSFEHDQELDSLLVGPVPVGVNKFIFTADPPSPDLIPASELVSVTVILLSCSYAGKEFVRVGYYVNNEYDSEELRLNNPSKVQVDKVVRNILAEKPRVTRFNIVW
jgi:histone chaperone ASF1